MKRLRLQFPRLATTGVYLALLQGCSGSPVVEESQEPRSSGNASLSTTGQTSNQSPPQNPLSENAKASAQDNQQDEQDLQELTLRIAKKVATARELPLTRPFEVREVSRSEVRIFVEKQLNKHIPEDQLELMGRVDASLGIIPEGVDHRNLLLDLYEKGVLGFYDPEERTLLLGDFLSDAMLGMVAGHEAAHGIQDMHFDLLELEKPNPGMSDLDSAKTFLVEGDAQVSYMVSRGGKAGIEAFPDELLARQTDMVLALTDPSSKTPILDRMMQLPYTEGTRTIAEIVRKHGWSTVNELYQQLPTTTEQLLHPEKLMTKEAAMEMPQSLPKLEKSLLPWKRVWTDQLGESSLLAMLSSVHSPKEARKAAAGWGGARLWAFDHPTIKQNTPFIVAVIAWDQREDAKEFEEAFRKYLEEKFSSGYRFERKENTTVLLLRLPKRFQEMADQLMKKAWASIGDRR